MSDRAKSVYASDISYGSTPFRRGHWASRLPVIDADALALEKFFQADATSAKYIAANPRGQTRTSARHVRPFANAPLDPHAHTPSESFHPGNEIPLTITTPPTVTEATLWYRHVNHGERWLSTPMQHSGGIHTAAIPAAYTSSPYPLQYYFELRTATSAILHPPFNSTWSNQPYYAIHQRT